MHQAIQAKNLVLIFAIFTSVTGAKRAQKEKIVD